MYSRLEGGIRLTKGLSRARGPGRSCALPPSLPLSRSECLPRLLGVASQKGELISSGRGAS